MNETLLQYWQIENEKFTKNLEEYKITKKIEIFNKLFYILQKQILISIYEKKRLNKVYYINMWLHLFNWFYNILDQKVGKIDNKYFNNKYTLEYFTKESLLIIKDYLEDETSIEDDFDNISEFCFILLLESRTLDVNAVKILNKIFGLSIDYCIECYNYAVAKLREFNLDMSNDFCKKFVEKYCKGVSPSLEKILKDMIEEVGHEGVARLIFKYAGSKLYFPKLNRGMELVNFEETCKEFYEFLGEKE